MHDSKPILNDLNIYKADLSEKGDMYIVKLENGRLFKVDERTKLIIDEIDGNKDYYEIAESLALKYDSTLNGEELEEFVISQLGPKGFLKNVEATGSSVNKTKFWVHLNLLKGGKFENSSKKFMFLYKKTLALIILVLIAIVTLIAININTPLISNIFFKNGHNTIKSSYLTPIFLFILLFIGTLFHEFGHIVSCYKFGVKPRNVGVGLYLLIPVLFCDLTEAWILDRKKRVIIDLSGFYFELVYLLALFPLFLINKGFFNIYNYSILNQCLMLAIIFNFNPFLRMDGYWILSDLLGIVNTHQRTMDNILSPIRKVFKPKNETSYNNYELLPKYEKIFKVWSFVYFIITLAFLYIGIRKLYPLLKNSKIYIVIIIIFIVGRIFFPKLVSKIKKS